MVIYMTSVAELLKCVQHLGLVQWLKIRLPVQKTWIPSLIQEESTCCGATKLICLNYWASALESMPSRAHGLQC